MADTSLPALLEEAQPIAVEDRLRTRLTSHSLAWVDQRLVPTSSIIPSSLALAELREEYELSCRPANIDTLKAWLTLLWVGTKKPASMNEFRTDNVFNVYAAALAKYPADLVEKALSTWTSTPKPKDAYHWWPSIGEIEDAIRGPSETRRLIKNAINGWDMERGKYDRLSQLYRELAVLEGGDFTFQIRHLLHASRQEQIDGIREEMARVHKQIIELEGPNTLSRAAGDN